MIYTLEKLVRARVQTHELSQCAAVVFCANTECAISPPPQQAQAQHISYALHTHTQTHENTG